MQQSTLALYFNFTNNDTHMLKHAAKFALTPPLSAAISGVV